MALNALFLSIFHIQSLMSISLMVIFQQESSENLFSLLMHKSDNQGKIKDNSIFTGIVDHSTWEICFP